MGPFGGRRMASRKTHATSSRSGWQPAACMAALLNHERIPRLGLVVQIQGHGDRPHPVRGGRVVRGVAKILARRHGALRPREVLLEEVEHVVLARVHAALAAMLVAEHALRDAPVLCLAGLARTLAAWRRLRLLAPGLVVQVQRHLGGPHAVRGGRVILGVAEVLAGRDGVVRRGEVLLEEVEQVVLLGIHAALAAVMVAEEAVRDAPVLLLAGLARALAARRRRGGAEARRGAGGLRAAASGPRPNAAGETQGVQRRALAVDEVGLVRERALRAVLASQVEGEMQVGVVHALVEHVRPVAELALAELDRAARDCLELVLAIVVREELGGQRDVQRRGSSEKARKGDDRGRGAHHRAGGGERAEHRHEKCRA
eukprot:CAMPEP_0204610400 /NCGR_PEP_ID=MMETSP0661-20131031/61483_1 /ASSEMBLY_ACC=CAM_ASM_000606 /TAXON_ID=109239 /ORGANISM="Alexandrium margalefi, Strain AMGDE01CS-322" /LENGTH=371 /DNA_ID=CAMNT_0051622207 /DNA_START=605 /DNA_END=1721 /DNA_ORIENTATION=+